MEDYISDDETWMKDHISIVFSDVETSIKVKIWDMDEQDFARLKREAV